jgi:hypothetical protein
MCAQTCVDFRGPSADVCRANGLVISHFNSPFL